MGAPPTCRKTCPAHDLSQCGSTRIEVQVRGLEVTLRCCDCQFVWPEGRKETQAKATERHTRGSRTA
jgi:hypothetical protein